ncbi:MAG: hypothetical protein QOC68_4534 [Solirubrobacteraceae bacterium]|nr:hypothetical protein [Solirubrobacteraceae bacterium]
MVCPRFRRVQDDRAVHPALAGVVLGDVGDRNLYRPVRSNSPLHQILRDQLRPTSTPPGPAGHALDRGPVHQHLHLADEIGQPRVTDLARRGATAAELVVTRLRDVQDPGGHLHRQPFAGHHRDRFEPPFAGTTFPSSSLARRWIASSVSSLATRRFAAVSSAFSVFNLGSGPCRPGPGAATSRPTAR